MHRISLVLLRVVAVVPVLFGVSLLVFAVVDLLPGTAAQSLLGIEATRDEVKQLEASLDLDRPAITRYLHWLGNLLEGDFGRSLSSGQPVAILIAQGLTVTIELVFLALAISATFAILMALLAARRPGGPWDTFGAVSSMICISLPNYVLAIVLVLVFSVDTHILRSFGFSPMQEGLSANIKSLTMPAIALAAPFFGICTRFLRGDLLEQMYSQRYVDTARAKGLGEWSVLLKHVLPNSLFGLVTVIGLNVGTLIGGTVVIEQIFALPGLGHLLLQAIAARDMPVVQAVVLLMAVATVLATVCVDFAYVALDPRQRHALS